MNELAADNLMAELGVGHNTARSSGAAPALSPGQWGMISFLVSEVAFFSTLIVTYIASVNPSGSNPTPAVLSLPLVLGTTACLISSSFTLHLAERHLERGRTGGFLTSWGLTILLALLFLGGTAFEWRDLIVEHGLTISVNIFGSCYYTLVGFHALHVTVGVLIMMAVWWIASRRSLPPINHAAVELVGWYWHFVDAVWVVVFLVVYVFCK